MENQKVVINSITDIFELFEKRLAEGVEKFPLADRVDVVRLNTFTPHATIRPKGEYGILFTGIPYEAKDTKSSLVRLKQNVLMSVVSTIRFLDSGFVSTEKIKRNTMLPAEYPEQAVNILTGIEILSTRASYDRKIVPLKTDFVEEKDGTWTYVTTFLVPCDFTEINYNE